jgi:hypothetical protein
MDCSMLSMTPMGAAGGMKWWFDDEVNPARGGMVWIPAAAAGWTTWARRAEGAEQDVLRMRIVIVGCVRDVVLLYDGNVKEGCLTFAWWRLMAMARLEVVGVRDL